MAPILIAFDFSPVALLALQRTLARLAVVPVHDLHVVCVIDPRVPLHHLSGSETPDAVQRALCGTVDRELAPLSRLERLDIHLHVRVGSPDMEILAVAREIGAGTIAIGSRTARARDRFSIGSVARCVVHRAECSVELVREHDYVNDAELPTTCIAASVVTYPATLAPASRGVR